MPGIKRADASAPGIRRSMANDFPSDDALLGRSVRFARRRRQQITYMFVGAWNTVFGYVAWALMQFLLGGVLHYLVILVLAWPIAVINAYLCYRHFVFHSNGSIVLELPRFSLVYVVTLVSGLVALPVLLHTLPFSIYVIQAGYTAVVVVLSYLFHKFFSFSGARNQGDPA